MTSISTKKSYAKVRQRFLACKHEFVYQEVNPEIYQMINDGINVFWDDSRDSIRCPTPDSPTNLIVNFNQDENTVTSLETQ